MYDEVYHAMEKAGVVQKLSEPMWVDEKQLITKKENTFGQQVTHLLFHPEYCFLLMKWAALQARKGMRQEGERKKKLLEEQLPRNQQQQTTTTLPFLTSLLQQTSQLCVLLLFLEKP